MQPHEFLSPHVSVLTDEIISHLECPIGRGLMVMPVVTASGHTFSLLGLLHWLRDNHTCPITRMELRRPGYVSEAQLTEWFRATLQPNRVVADMVDTVTRALPFLHNHSLSSAGF